MKNKDFFDKVMELLLLRVFNPFYKAHKRMLLYLLFGFLTTLINIVLFFVLNTPLKLNEHVSNVIAWIGAVWFAFITNRVIVFKSKVKTKRGHIREMLRFYLGRLCTLIIEEAIILVFITWLGLNSLAIKLSAQIIVVVLNYVFSRVFVFNDK